MGDTIFDQLKKAGLANKSQVRKARTEKHQQVKSQGNRKPKPMDETAQAEKFERDRQLNAARQAEIARKELTGQIKQIFNNHRQSKGVGAGRDEGIAYNFTEDNKIKTILVSKKVQQQLSKGQLAIARFNYDYELIAIVVANKIVARAPTGSSLATRQWKQQAKTTRTRITKYRWFNVVTKYDLVLVFCLKIDAEYS